MSNQITIYDPIHLKKHTLDFSEFRFWLDVPRLQLLFKNSEEVNERFTDLDGPQREFLLQLLDKHETTIPFKINNWKGVEGLSVSFQLHVNYTPQGNAFVDEINQNIKDQIFFSKEIETMRGQGVIHIGENEFPIENILAFSEDFCKTETLDSFDAFPVFYFYSGNGSEFDEKFFLNHRGEIEPILFNHTILEDGEWKYILEVKIETTHSHEEVLWTNIPQNQLLYDFFRDKGYRIEESGDHLTHFVHNKKGNIIEYSKPPEHLYPPFISVREHNSSKLYKDRKDLGENLIEELKENGIWEEITYFRGYLLETEAMDKIQNKNKRFADELLSLSIAEYDKCDSYLQTQSQLEAIFCAWLKGLIARSSEDKEVELRSYKNILERYADLHMWEDFVWFLDRIEEIDKRKPYQLVKDFLPIYEIDKFFFMKPNTYRRILEYWDNGPAKDRPSNREKWSEWYHDMAHQAYEIGLKNTARHHLLMFFKLAERNPEGCEWAIEGTEELLDFAVKVGAKKQYMRFSQTMAKHMRNKRKTQGIGDMSALGRKAYRWKMLTLTLSEARWSFHAGYMLKNEKKEKPEQIKQWFYLAYEAFHQALLHYDPTENYSLDQIVTIGKGFITGYHLGFSVRDENQMLNMLDYARELWDRNPSKELYVAMHSMFQTEERKEMADSLITNWINEVKEKTGGFELNVDKILILSDLYASIEEWEESVKTLNHGLNNFDWNFDEINRAFKVFMSIQPYAPNVASQLEEGLYNQMQKFQQEKINNVAYAKSVRVRIRKVSKI